MATYRQDAAPPGGYKDIEWARYYGKRPNGLKILGVILAMKGLGFTWFYVEKKKFDLERYEEADWRISLMPFYLAETDRQRMKQFRSMRDHEAELMKNNADWKVGTWKGMELYHNQQNKFNENLATEQKVFSEKQTLKARMFNWLFSSSEKDTL